MVLFWMDVDKLDVPNMKYNGYNNRARKARKLNLVFVSHRFIVGGLSAQESVRKEKNTPDDDDNITFMAFRAFLMMRGVHHAPSLLKTFP